MSKSCISLSIFRGILEKLVDRRPTIWLDFWLGLKESTTSSGWFWVDGKMALDNETHWYTGGIGYSGIYKNETQCAVMWSNGGDGGQDHDLLLYATSCSSDKWYPICQYHCNWKNLIYMRCTRYYPFRNEYDFHSRINDHL